MSSAFGVSCAALPNVSSSSTTTGLDDINKVRIGDIASIGYDRMKGKRRGLDMDRGACLCSTVHWEGEALIIQEFKDSYAYTGHFVDCPKCKSTRSSDGTCPQSGNLFPSSTVCASLPRMRLLPSLVSGTSFVNFER